MLTTSDFDYILPEERIAQEPAPIRDACKMLVMNRTTGEVEDRIFRDIIEYINPGDVLIANETRVLPARLLGHKRQTGGAAEVFLLRPRPATDDTNTQGCWEVLVRPGKRLKPGAQIDFTHADGSLLLTAEIVDFVAEGKGERIARLSTNAFDTLDEALHAVGHTPLPPYIKHYVGDEEMYQTVYSNRETSAAAPTAGLHFTPELIEKIKAKGAFWETVELQVGIDTFRIVEEEDPTKHQMHTETYSVPQRVIDAINDAHARGNKVIAVGTTSTRSLESAWDEDLGMLVERDQAQTSLFLFPGSTFHAVDALITNFHVPRSTLMMLVSAFSSRDHIMAAYQHAIEQEYRMLSFGDAMFICD